MRSIGEMARASGLTVSALRFYDRVGVLVPAFVDPETGYRWYRQDQVRPARIVAALRRVGVPLPDIILVLARRADRVAVQGLLNAHLRRLEDGLADARRELSRVHALLDHEENAMTISGTPTRLTLASRDFAAALDAVRFAVSNDPDLPALGGVLVELDNAAVRLVATDRYRLAVAQAPARRVAGAWASAVVPAGLLDQARPSLDGGADLTLVLDGTDIVLQSEAWQVSGECLDQEFPDYRRLIHTRDARRVPVDVAALQNQLATGPTRRLVRQQDGVTCEVSVLTLDTHGRLAVELRDSSDQAEQMQIGVNREFLLQALAASGQSQLVLELDGPITPLALRLPDNDSTFTILMPTLLS